MLIEGKVKKIEIKEIEGQGSQHKFYIPDEPIASILLSDRISKDLEDVICSFEKGDYAKFDCIKVDKEFKGKAYTFYNITAAERTLQQKELDEGKLDILKKELKKEVVQPLDRDRLILAQVAGKCVAMECQGQWAKGDVVIDTVRDGIFDYYFKKFLEYGK